MENLKLFSLAEVKAFLHSKAEDDQKKKLFCWLIEDALHSKQPLMSLEDIFFLHKGSHRILAEAAAHMLLMSGPKDADCLMQILDQVSDYADSAQIAVSAWINALDFCEFSPYISPYRLINKLSWRRRNELFPFCCTVAARTDRFPELFEVLHQLATKDFYLVARYLSSSACRNYKICDDVFVILANADFQSSISISQIWEAIYEIAKAYPFLQNDCEEILTNIIRLESASISFIEYSYGFEDFVNQKADDPAYHKLLLCALLSLFKFKSNACQLENDLVTKAFGKCLKYFNQSGLAETEKPAYAQKVNELIPYLVNKNGENNLYLYNKLAAMFASSAQGEHAYDFCYMDEYNLSFMENLLLSIDKLSSVKQILDLWGYFVALEHNLDNPDSTEGRERYWIQQMINVVKEYRLRPVWLTKYELEDINTCLDDAMRLSWLKPSRREKYSIMLHYLLDGLIYYNVCGAESGIFEKDYHLISFKLEYKYLSLKSRVYLDKVKLYWLQKLDMARRLNEV